MFNLTFSHKKHVRCGLVLLSLALVFTITAIPALAQASQPTGTALVCFDAFGNPRLSATSVAADLCYTRQGQLTSLTFGQYALALTRNSTATVGAPGSTNPNPLGPSVPTVPAQEPLATLPNPQAASPSENGPTPLDGAPMAPSVPEGTTPLDVPGGEPIPLLPQEWLGDSPILTETPTVDPSAMPGTETPTVDPSAVPGTETPTVDPSAVPGTETPTVDPSAMPGTETPTVDPSAVPGTETPTVDPSAMPGTETPTVDPSAVPGTATPTVDPSAVPDTPTPTVVPSAIPDTPTPTPTMTATLTTVNPGKPVLIAPNNESTTRTQTFSWNLASDTTKYTLNWRNEWGNTGSVDLPANDPACGAASCSLTIVLPIEGKYTWTVTAKNAGPYETVSNEMTFRVNPNITTPDGILPSGAIGNKRWVSFVFTDVRDNVVAYNIKIYNEAKNEVLDAKRDVKDLYFSNGRVTFNVYVDLPAGRYTWRVRGRSNNSLSNWSAPIEIRVGYAYVPPVNPTPQTYKPIVIQPAATATPAVPSSEQQNTEPRLLFPADNGKINAEEAAISWIDQGEHVAYYEVAIRDKTGSELLRTHLDRNGAYCTGKNCRLIFESIDPDMGYTFQLTGQTATGEKSQTSELHFDVVDEKLPMQGLYPMEGQKTEKRPYFSWSIPTGTADPDKLTYALRLRSVANKTETIYSDLVCSDDRVGCFPGGGSFILTENLPSGEYTWQVQNKETNLMTEEMKFVVP